ncbi:MAG: hypothetical protein HY270_13620 [Deltaproteobacteria bacterium]|nr:hypothetical protein [Deltaproteobacteria bacterium]
MPQARQVRIKHSSIALGKPDSADRYKIRFKQPLLELDAFRHERIAIGKRGNRSNGGAFIALYERHRSPCKEAYEEEAMLVQLNSLA